MIDPRLVAASQARREFDARRAVAVQQQQAVVQQRLAQLAGAARTTRGVQTSPIQRGRQQQAPVEGGTAGRPPTKGNVPTGGGGGGGIDWNNLVGQSNELYGTSQGGGGGGAGDFFKGFGNAIVKGVLKGAEIWDTPRRAVQATIKEASDFFVKGGAGMLGKAPKDPNMLGGDDASLGDWWSAVSGKSDIGFQQWLPEDARDSLAGSIVGFVGDVALDPTTYIMPGASELAGTGGRAALAGRAALKELGEDAVERAGRLGVAGLTQVEREALDVGDLAYRFGTPKHNIAIPGTQKLGEARAAVMSKLRTTASDTGLGRLVRKIGNDKDMLPYLERLATGKGGGTATDAANQIAALVESRGRIGSFKGQFERPVTRIAKSLTGRNDVYHAIEAGVRNADTDALLAVKDAMFTAARNKGGVTALKYRQNQMPHYNTEDFEDFLGRSSEGAGFRTGKEVGDASGRLESRVFEPGKSYQINGQTISFPEGPQVTAQQITDEFQAKFPELQGKKLIEDDPSIVLPRLLEDHAADVGQAAWESRLKRGGSLVDQATVMDQVPDKGLTKEANDQIATYAQADIKARRKERTDLAASIRDKIAKATKDTKERAAADLKAAKAQRTGANANMRTIEGLEAKGAKAQATERARVIAEGKALRKQYMDGLAAVDAADAEVTRLQKVWLASDDPTAKQGLQAAIDKRKALVDQMKQGMEAEKVSGQIVEPERMFVGQTEGPPTAITPRAGEAVAQGEQGLLERTMGRQGQLERDITGMGDPATIDDEFVRKLASVAEGRDVQPRSDAEATLARLERSSPKREAKADVARERAVREAIGRGAEVGQATKTMPYGEAERQAAKRGLTPEQLADPELFSKGVLENMPPNVAKAWEEARQALDEKIAPYRTGPSAQAGRVPKEAEVKAALEQRKALIRDIEALQREMDKMKTTSRLVPAEGGGVRTETLERSPRYANFRKARDEKVAELNKLRKEAPRTSELTTELPLKRAIENNPEIRAVADDAADVAEFIARYHRALGAGAPPGLATERAVAEHVLTNRAGREAEEVTRLRRADGQYKQVTNQGQWVPRYSPEEIDQRLEAEWNQYVSSVRNRVKAEAEQGVVKPSIGAPAIPAPVKPKKPTLDDARKLLAERGGEVVFGSTGEGAATGARRVITDPRELKTELDARFERALGQWERDTERHAEVLRLREREQRQAANRVNAPGQRPTLRQQAQGVKSKAQFMDERRPILERKRMRIPTGANQATINEADNAMAGEFANVLQPLMEDVSAARSAKNKLDAEARKAGHRMGGGPPATTAGEDPTLANLPGTTGAPMKLEDWQAAMAAEEQRLAAMPAGARQPGAATPGARAEQEKLRQELARNIGLSSGEGGDLTGIELDRALTTLRSGSRKELADTEREVMRTIEDLTGVKWENNRPALTVTAEQHAEGLRPRQRKMSRQEWITTIKGKGVNKWQLNGGDATFAQVKDFLVGKGMPEEFAEGTTSIKRMLQKWAGDKLPGTIDWSKANEKTLVRRLGLSNQRKGMLQLVPINRDLSPAEQMAVYLEGVSDDAYRYIDSKQAGAINDLYRRIDPEAKGKFAKHTELRRQAAERRATDTNIRLGRIDAPGGGVSATHDPLAMATGQRDPVSGLKRGRSDNALYPPSPDDLARQELIAKAIMPEAAQHGTTLRNEAEWDRMQRQLAAEQLARMQHEEALSSAQEAAGAAQAQLEATPDQFVRQGGFIDPISQDASLRQPGMGTPNEGQFEANLAARDQAIAEAQRMAAVGPEPDITRAAGRVRREEAPNIRAAKRVEAVTTGPGPRPRPLPADLSDISGAQARRTAEADIAAIEEAQAGVQRSAREFTEGRQQNYRVAQEADVAATRQLTEGLRAAGETRAAYDTAKQAELQQRLEDLGGKDAIRQGMEARAQFEGKTLADMSQEEQARIRMDLADDMTKAQDVAAQARTQAATTRKAMEAASVQHRQVLQSQADNMDILAGAADQSLAHSYSADKLIGDAQRNLDHWKTAAPKRRDESLQAYQDWINDTEKWLGSDISDDAKDLFKSALNDSTGRVMPNGRIVGGFQRIDRKIADGQKFIKDIKDGKQVVEVMKDQLRSGYVAFKSQVTGEDLAVSAELDRMMRNQTKMFKDPGKLGAALDTYTRFFKAYATATPAFHIRNAMSATFMNAADGVSLANMIGGTRIAAAYMRDPDSTKAVAQGLKGWWETLPPHLQTHAQDVMQAVYNSGAGGQFSAQEIGRRAYTAPGKHKVGNLVNRNVVIRGSQRTGEAVEMGARAGMALDSLSRAGQAGRSGTLEGATARINRIHFNYSQVSSLDATMRRIIPFWTFMSRNVPLQAQMMYTNPRAYQHYRSFARNFTDENQDQSALPEWMQQGGAIRLTGATALMPDVGATQFEDQVKQLTTPSRLLSAMGPAQKVPLQLITNRNFFYDSPYRENDFVKTTGELAPLGPLAEMLGGGKLPGGGEAIPRKWADALRSVLPTAGQINRVGGTSPDQEAKQAYNIANLMLGIPVRSTSPEVLQKEQERRQRKGKTDTAADQARLDALRRLAAS